MPVAKMAAIQVTGADHLGDGQPDQDDRQQFHDGLDRRGVAALVFRHQVRDQALERAVGDIG